MYVRGCSTKYRQPNRKNGNGDIIENSIDLSITKFQLDWIFLQAPSNISWLGSQVWISKECATTECVKVFFEKASIFGEYFLDDI